VLVGMSSENSIKQDKKVRDIITVPSHNLDRYFTRPIIPRSMTTAKEGL
jgi:hypothetical protein